MTTVPPALQRRDSNSWEYDASIVLVNGIRDAGKGERSGQVRHWSLPASQMLLADRGDQAMHRADRTERYLGVLFIDLDRFNSINDSLGHDIGDQVLAAVTQRFAGVVREDDTLARFGGDEFVCLLPDIATCTDVSLIAGKLLAALETPIEVTESLFIKDAESAAATLNDIVALGVSLALDDFGTGYSNLGSLSQLPLDTFKLDQGYRYGKPMAEESFLAHLANWRPEQCCCPVA
jgi:diguanylate cyclase (GGDEF)-like protein